MNVARKILKVLVNAADICHVNCCKKFVYYNRTLLTIMAKCTNEMVAQVHYIGLFISPSGISELDCATTKTDTAERRISIGRESLQVFFLY